MPYSNEALDEALRFGDFRRYDEMVSENLDRPKYCQSKDHPKEELDCWQAPAGKAAKPINPPVCRICEPERFKTIVETVVRGEYA